MLPENLHANKNKIITNPNRYQHLKSYAETSQLNKVKNNKP